MPKLKLMPEIVYLVYGKMITLSRRGNGEEENTDLMIAAKKFF